MVQMGAGTKANRERRQSYGGYAASGKTSINPGPGIVSVGNGCSCKLENSCPPGQQGPPGQVGDEGIANSNGYNVRYNVFLYEKFWLLGKVDKEAVRPIW